MPITRRRCIFPLALDQKKPPSGREAVGPRTPKGLHPTPPAATPCTITISFEDVNWIRRHQIQRGKTRTRRSRRTASAGKEMLRRGTPGSFTAEGDEHHLQTQHRPRHHLHDDAGWVPTTTYAIYTPGSGDSPPSRRRSGRWRAGNHADRRRRGGSRRGSQKSPLSYCAGGGTGPRSVWFLRAHKLQTFWLVYKSTHHTP